MFCSERSSPPNQIGATPVEIADHDPIGMVLADRNLVNADGLQSRRASFRQLRAHAPPMQFLNRIPVKLDLQSQTLDRLAAAAPTHVMRKALGVESGHTFHVGGIDDQ